MSCRLVMATAKFETERLLQHKKFLFNQDILLMICSEKPYETIVFYVYTLCVQYKTPTNEIEVKNESENMHF
jgi:hypothetical protein